MSTKLNPRVWVGEAVGPLLEVVVAEAMEEVDTTLVTVVVVAAATAEVAAATAGVVAATVAEVVVVAMETAVVVEAVAMEVEVVTTIAAEVEAVRISISYIGRRSYSLSFSNCFYLVFCFKSEQAMEEDTMIVVGMAEAVEVVVATVVAVEEVVVSIDVSMRLYGVALARWSPGWGNATEGFEKSISRST